MQNIKNLFFIMLLLNCFSSFNAEKRSDTIILSIGSYDRTILGFNITSPTNKQIDEKIAALKKYVREMSLTKVKDSADIYIRYTKGDANDQTKRYLEYTIRPYSREIDRLKTDPEIKSSITEFKETVEEIIKDLESLKK